MNDLDDLDILAQVMGANAPAWTQAQRDSLTAAATAYLARSTPRADLIRAVQSIARDPGPSSSWSVFATWLVRRAGRFGQECRDTPFIE